MSNITRTKTLLIIALGALVVAVGIYVFMYRAVVRAYTTLVTTELEYTAVTREREQRDEVRAFVTETSEMRSELAGYLLASDDPIDFLNLLEQMGQEANVLLTVVSLSREEPVVAKGTNNDIQAPQVRVALLVEGAWENIYHLLALLETMPYSLSIDRVHVTEEKTETGFVWSGQIGISVNTRE